MQDVLVALLAIVVGAVFCFFGCFAMRIVISVWGTFAGFMLGAGFVDAATDDGFLRTALAWFVGVAVGLLFGLIAYLYYEVSVVLAMAAIGFTLGTSVMAALGVSWSWLTVLVGVLAGTLLAFVAIVGDLPTVLLMFLTAIAGANVVVFGLMLLVGAVDTADFESADATERLEDDWWWYVIFVALAVAGLVAQLSYVRRARASLRAQWANTGGRQLRSS